MKRFLLSLFVYALLFEAVPAQIVVNLNPVQDNSIYAANFGNSNGLGRLFSGVPGSGLPNRALLQFDLTSIPTTATVSAAVLTLDLEGRGPLSAGEPYDLHALVVPWAEGGSVAGPGIPGTNGGAGAPAIPPDATWILAISPVAAWIAAGGDFVPLPSATSIIPAGPPGPYMWAGPGMVADAQAWVTAPATNFGWILKDATELLPNSGSRWGSKDQGIAPVLTVTYTNNLSVDEVDLNDIKIYPNPTEGIIDLGIGPALQITSAEIFNLLGQNILKFENEQIDSRQLDISSLQSGTYLLQISTENGSTIKRIVKR